MIGAFQSGDRRYLEYVDGSIMNDGSFSDVPSNFFGDVYGTGKTIFSMKMLFCFIKTFTKIQNI